MTSSAYDIILNAIEEIETVMLSWGIVDTTVSYQDLSIIIQNEFNSLDENSYSLSVGQIIKELLNRGLIYRFGEGPSATEENLYFRTRMAETVRLAFLLRQQFPRHAGDGGWQSAPRLVSDYRFAREHRRFPKLSVSPDHMRMRLEKLELSDDHRKALNSLIKSYASSNYLFREFQAQAAIVITKKFELSKKASNPKKYDEGVIVTSGTGSGKTLAFYLPVLGRISAKILSSPDPKKNWLQCLAIYPRVELQRDQFQSLFKEARRLNELLEVNGKRKLRLGILYGDTPGFFGSKDASLSREQLSKKWKSAGNGFVCPYFKCWNDGCTGNFIWLFEDVNKREEKLVCSKCDEIIDSDEIALSRCSIQNKPPDILFASSEMLNRCLSDNSYRLALGFIEKAPFNPEFLLVDEAHIYSGSFGAQFAYLIRRWRYQLRAPIVIVGLSATLVDAERYFEELVGLPNGVAQLVSPSFSDLVDEGVGYLVALKGDPVSKTALLSTTIQANMLFSRMLDKDAEPISKGIFGTKLFTFADDIDVANRLFWNTRDAEGFGRNAFGTLAQLREPGLSTSRKNEGQDWEFAEKISGSLSNSKMIERVSSQDKGLDPGSEIVVATSSLEVGFDDPNVGAVIQHKSPRNFAGFLQRKGRAGRRSKMRPWTAVVLSDFGRDRMSFQSYEQLFDPEIERALLPIKSSHIRRIQATYFLLDFLARQIALDKNVTAPRWKQKIWDLVRFTYDEKSDERYLQKTVASYLHEIILNDVKRQNFMGHLRRSLMISEREANAIFWGHPRPLMTSVIPVILRKLGSDLLSKSAEEDVDQTPLPNFLPSALFSDLNLPELSIELPNADRTIHKMPILQGLNAFTPGKVSKRFGIDHENQRHWLELHGLGTDEILLNIAQEGFETKYLGEWNTSDGRKVNVYRPIKMPIKIPERGIKDTSNAFANWQSGFEISQNASVMPISEKVGAAAKIFKKISVHTHQSGCPLTVKRYFENADANIKRRNSEDLFVTVGVVDDKEHVAIGFETEVDAIVFEIELDSVRNASNLSKFEEHLPSLRTKMFFSEVVKSTHLDHIKNPFLRSWVSSVFFDSVCFVAISKDTSIETSAEIVLSDDNDFKYEEILEKLFQSNDITSASDEDREQGFEADEEEKDQLKEEILSTLRASQTKTSLRKAAEMLSLGVDDWFLDWIESAAANSLGKIIAETAKRLMPHFDETEVVVDVVRIGPVTNKGDISDCYQIILSEIAPGGIGLVEDLADEFALDPRMFFSVVSSVVSANEQEIVDYQLRGLIEDTQLEGSIFAQKFADYRNASSVNEKDAHRVGLIDLLTRNEKILFHSFLTTLFSRVLRPGTSTSSDQLYAEIMSFWTNLNKALGLEIDSRVIAFSYAAKFAGEIDHVLNSMGFQKPTSNLDLWRTNLVNSLLWSSGGAIRNIHLNSYNPFSNDEVVERIIVECLLDDENFRLELPTLDWENTFLDRISQRGVLTVSCPKKEQTKLAEFLNFITIQPVFDGYLKVYARVKQVKQHANNWDLTVELPEVAQ